MSVVLIIISIFSFNNSLMSFCFQIKNKDTLTQILSEDNRKWSDFDDQLNTNSALIFHLSDGKVLLFRPNDSKGILYNDKECFKEMVETDSFPIENEKRMIYDFEVNYLKEINKNIKYFQNRLNEFTGNKVNHQLSRGVVKKYIDEFVAKTNSSQDFEPEDVLSMIVIIGELLRKECGGKWVVRKWYHGLNPSYEPIVLTEHGELISFCTKSINYLGTEKLDNYDNFLNAFLVSDLNPSFEKALSNGMPYILLD